jgi:hypothetical protein
MEEGRPTGWPFLFFGGKATDRTKAEAKTEAEGKGKFARFAKGGLTGRYRRRVGWVAAG